MHLTCPPLPADLPFARLDSILLLIKNHLKGEIPSMLNAKDNQVFMDYLSGGHSKDISREREANASSNGVMSVAARNIMGALAAAAPKGKAISPSVLSQAMSEHMDRYAIIKEASNDAHKLVASMAEADKVCNSFFERVRDKVTWLQDSCRTDLELQEEFEALEHKSLKNKAQFEAMEKRSLKRKAEFMELEEQIHRDTRRYRVHMNEHNLLHKQKLLEQELLYKQKALDMERAQKQKLQEQELQHKQKVQEQELQHKKVMLDLSMQEAKVMQQLNQAMQERQQLLRRGHGASNNQSRR
jgi:hypothetical protein